MARSAFALADTAHPITVNTLLPGGGFPSKMMRATIRAAGEATIAE